MVDIDGTYAALRRLTPGDRRRWLREHVPVRMRGHWWLSVVERAEWEASPHRSLPRDVLRRNATVAVDLIEAAVEVGMPPHYAADHLMRLATTYANAGLAETDLPAAVTPNEAAEYALGAFRLSTHEALEAAARRRTEALEEGAWVRPGQSIDFSVTQPDDEISRLQDIERLLWSLERLAPHVTDEQLVHTIGHWLALREQLDPGEEAAAFGKELLARDLGQLDRIEEV